jgi:hypothetical protein
MIKKNKEFSTHFATDSEENNSLWSFAAKNALLPTGPSAGHINAWDRAA